MHSNIHQNYIEIKREESQTFFFPSMVLEEDKANEREFSVTYT